MTDIFIFAEDPGAANFVAPLIASLSQLGINSEVFATGFAEKIFQARGEAYHKGIDQSEVEAMIDRYQPRLILVGTASNLDSTGLLLVDIAKRKGIQTVGAVDAAMNAEQRFSGHSQNPLAHIPDWILAPDNITAEAFVSFGVPFERIFVTGNPHFSYVADSRLAWAGQRAALRCQMFPDAPPDREILLFAAEGSSRVHGESPERRACYGLLGRGGQGRTEIALEETLLALGDVSPRPYVVLRIHPKDRPEDYATYAEEIDLLSSGGDSLKMLFASDMVIGTTSMLMTEAVILGCPTVAIILTDGEERWLPSMGIGLTHVARSRSEVRTLMREMPGSTHSKVDALAVTYLAGSRERVVNVLAQLLGTDQLQ